MERAELARSYHRNTVICQFFIGQEKVELGTVRLCGLEPHQQRLFTKASKAEGKLEFQFPSYSAANVVETLFTKVYSILLASHDSANSHLARQSVSELWLCLAQVRS